MAAEANVSQSAKAARSEEDVGNDPVKAECRYMSSSAVFPPASSVAARAMGDCCVRPPCWACGAARRSTFSFFQLDPRYIPYCDAIPYTWLRWEVIRVRWPGDSHAACSVVVSVLIRRVDAKPAFLQPPTPWKHQTRSIRPRLQSWRSS